MSRSCLALSCALVGLVGCSEKPVPMAASTEAATVSAPAFTRGPAVAPPEPSPSATATADADGDEETAGQDTADGADSGAEAEAEPTPTGPLPEVDIATHGMHIGGGPNDAATKAPIRAAVLAKRDAFRACFALVEDKGKAGTFGVDVRIPREGGRAEVSKPRPGLKGDGVSDCVVRAFESVEFAKPPKGAPMVVSISLHFQPKR